MENASTEDASTSLHGWKTQVWKTQVRIHTSAHHAVQVLNTTYTGRRVDTGSSTDEYDWEDVTDNTQSPITTSGNTTATATVVTAPASASCENAPRVTVALLPCGHATFCQQRIDTLIATNSHCPVSRCHIYYCPVLQLAVEQF